MDLGSIFSPRKLLEWLRNLWKLYALWYIWIFKASSETELHLELYFWWRLNLKVKIALKLLIFPPHLHASSRYNHCPSCFLPCLPHINITCATHILVCFYGASFWFYRIIQVVSCQHFYFNNKYYAPFINFWQLNLPNLVSGRLNMKGWIKKEITL